MRIGLLSLATLLVACTPGAISTPSVELGGLEIVVVAGPVCPVEQDPPDPNCEPRPVADARILVQPADGRDILVGEGTTDEQGHVTIDLPAGDYLVAGAEVEGLMGVPELASVTVLAGETVALSLGYDTGIR